MCDLFIASDGDCSPLTSRGWYVLGLVLPLPNNPTGTYALDDDQIDHLETAAYAHAAQIEWQD